MAYGDIVLDPKRCQEKVMPNDRMGAFHQHQCRRKTWKDGFCQQHHPDTEKARQEEIEKRWKARMNRMSVISESGMKQLLTKACAKMLDIVAKCRDEGWHDKEAMWEKLKAYDPTKEPR